MGTQPPPWAACSNVWPLVHGTDSFVSGIVHTSYRDSPTAFKGRCLYTLCIKEKTHLAFLQMYPGFERKYSCEIITNGSVRQRESILCQIHTKHKQQYWITAYTTFSSTTEFLICSWVFLAPQFRKKTKVIFPVSQKWVLQIHQQQFLKQYKSVQPHLASLDLLCFISTQDLTCAPWPVPKALKCAETLLLRRAGVQQPPWKSTGYWWPVCSFLPVLFPRSPAGAGV